MEEHEYGFKHLSHDRKWYIYPTCKEKLLQAVKDGYKLEFDTEEIKARHKIWVPYDETKHNLDGHFTLYRIVPKEN